MRIVITGAGGRLGAALLREYREKFQPIGFDHKDLDLGEKKQIEQRLLPLDFDVLINCAALTNVDLCEKAPARAFQINAEGPEILAQICTTKKAKLIHFSTDYVFDGEKRQPYSEEDAAVPLGVYGQSKLEGEKRVLAAGNHHLVVRVSWVFGPDRPSFVDAVITRARENDRVDAVADKFSSPTYTHDIVEMLPPFFSEESVSGLLHFSNTGECSWQQYAQHALDCCRQAGVRLRTSAVEPLRLAEMTDFVARRPVYTVLSAAKYAKITGTLPRPWREAVADYIMRSYSKT